MAHLPARLPRTEADLADWSVYADQLLGECDPLGELIAHELALPATLERDAVAEYQARMTPHCWRDRRTMTVAWSLGFAHTLVLRNRTIKLANGARQQLDDGTLGWAADFVRSRRGSRLEVLELQLTQHRPSEKLWRLLEALPATCSTLDLRTARIGPAELKLVIERLPPHVTRLVMFGAVLFAPALARTLLERFVVVAPGVLPGERPFIKEILDELPAARLELTFRPSLVHPRCDLGDTGWIATSPSDHRLIVPASLLARQCRHGLIPIRTQLAATLPESEPAFENDGGESTLVRRGTCWTLRCGGEVVVANRRVPPNVVIELSDGDVVEHRGVVREFIARDFMRRFAER